MPAPAGNPPRIRSLYGSLKYQADVNEAMHALLPDHKGPVLSADELNALQRAWELGLTPEQFAQCVVDARALPAEQMAS